MAIYLAGFALGGVVGAMILSFGGFPTLATVIAVSGIIALPAAQSPRPSAGV